MKTTGRRGRRSRRQVYRARMEPPAAQSTRGLKDLLPHTRLQPRRRYAVAGAAHIGDTCTWRHTQLLSLSHWGCWSSSCVLKGRGRPGVRSTATAAACLRSLRHSLTNVFLTQWVVRLPRCRLPDRSAPLHLSWESRASFLLVVLFLLHDSTQTDRVSDVSPLLNCAVNSPAHAHIHLPHPPAVLPLSFDQLIHGHPGRN